MNTLVIERQALIHNFQLIKKHAKGAELIGDLSADAYGLGLREMARLLADEGVRSFAVDSAKDAERLRDKGFTEERIMALRSPSGRGELELLLELGVVCAVGSYETGVILNAIAESRNTVCEVQLMIDCGQGYYGFSPRETDKLFSVYDDMAALRVTGTFGVLSSPAGKVKRVRDSFNAFMDAVEALQSAGYDPGPLHLADGATVMYFDYCRLDAVRIGRELGGGPAWLNGGFKRAAYIEASVEEIDWLEKGARVGGGRGEKLKKPVRVAVLPAGAYNGFGLLAKGEESGGLKQRRKPLVTIGDQKAPLVGEIGLLDSAVDVTGIECRVGDVAVIELDPVYAKGVQRAYR